MHCRRYLIQAAIIVSMWGPFSGGFGSSAACAAGRGGGAPCYMRQGIGCDWLAMIRAATNSAGMTTKAVAGKAACVP